MYCELNKMGHQMVISLYPLPWRHVSQRRALQGYLTYKKMHPPRNLP